MNESINELTEYFQNGISAVKNPDSISDKVEPSLVETSNGSCCDKSETDTDVWFYLTDPETQMILGVNNTKVQDTVIDKSSQTSIRYTITGDLHVQASEIKTPNTEYFISSTPLPTSVKSLSTNQYAGYPAFLIAVGCFVFAMSVAAIIYLLIIYAK